MARLKPEDVRYWWSEIKSCIIRQEQELQKRNHYPYLIQYYEGEMFADEGAKRDLSSKKMAFINEYFPNTNQLINEIIFQYPEMMATPTKPQAEEGAPVMKSALAYATKKLDMLTEMKLGLFDMLFAGYCGIEIDHINIQPTESYIPAPEEQPKNFIQSMGESITDGIEKIKRFVGVEKEEQKTEEEAPPREMAYATQDETYLRRWNPLNVLLDYQAERVKDMRYVIKRIQVSYAKFCVMYPEFANKVSPEGYVPFSMHDEAKYKNLVTLYQIQLLKKNNEVENIIICPNYNTSEIDYFKRPYKTNGFNVKIGILHEYGKLYPVSMAQINKAIQDDINNYATFWMEVAERNIPKFVVPESLTPEAEAALRSTNVNDLVKVKGEITQGKITPLQPSSVSNENKELFSLFQQQKEKLWSVSKQRLGQKGEEDFATELNIQEAGFQVNVTGIQQGLKKVWLEVADSLKDIIVQFWDGKYWFKITGSDKPTWYEPEIDPLTGRVLNPLTDILVGDYEIDLEIISAFKPNKEKIKKELIDFATWLTSPNVQQYLMAQGYSLNINVIKKVATEWGWNAEDLLIQLPPQLPAPEGAPNASIPISM